MIEKRAEIGEKIRKNRIQKGLTQENLAEKICAIQNSGKGGNPQTISRIENAVNDFGIDMFLTVAEALEVPPELLLPDDGVNYEKWEPISYILFQNQQKSEEQFQCLITKLNQILNILKMLEP